MSQFFTSDGQCIGASASALVLPMNIPFKGLISFRIDWFDLLAAQGTLKSLFQLKSMNSSVPSFSYNSIITDLSVLP